MKEKLQQIRERALQEIHESKELGRLNEVRDNILGKKGELTSVLRGMKDVAPEDRPKVGQWVNETRAAIEEVLEEKIKKFQEEELQRKYKSEKIDVTMPAKQAVKGNLHPITQVRNQLIDIFFQAQSSSFLLKNVSNFIARLIHKNPINMDTIFNPIFIARNKQIK